MNPESSLLLRAEGIQKSYSKGAQTISVVRGVDLELRVGERVAITGASGAGKSTLLHILGTLESPSAGRVLFGKEQRDVFRLSERELSSFRNRSLGFVFQFHYLLPEFSALENVMMPALIAGHSPEVSEKHARELLTFVGLGHRLTHRPAELSGGEQQRVSIARSVILRPQLLLADELTGNLDSENSRVVMDYLVALSERFGIGILLVTHDQGLVGRMHRVLRMQDGVFVER
jgi:lipoprotein-releasing system ATP-binding protein